MKDKVRGNNGICLFFWNSASEGSWGDMERGLFTPRHFSVTPSRERPGGGGCLSGGRGRGEAYHLASIALSESNIKGELSFSFPFFHLPFRILFSPSSLECWGFFSTAVPKSQNLYFSPFFSRNPDFFIWHYLHKILFVIEKWPLQSRTLLWNKVSVGTRLFRYKCKVMV